MSYTTAQSAVIAHFNTQWAATTDVAWPNIKYDPLPGTEFVRFQYDELTDERITVASDLTDYRVFGLVIIQVFTELESGAKRSAELVEMIKTIFRSLLIPSDRIVFGDMTVVKVGQNDGFYQENVEISFYRNEQH